MDGRFHRTHSRRPRILIVEDEWMIAGLIENLIEDFGYAVSGTASNVSSARRELAKHNFDAVLLDIGLDGEVRPDIADILLARSVPFAFVTGYDHALHARHANVPLIRKPFNTRQFIALLNQLVGPGDAVRVEETSRATNGHSHHRNPSCVE